MDFATRFVLDEVDRLNKAPRGRTWRNSVVISSNLSLRQDGLPYSGQPQPKDTGIAIYFPLNFRRGDKTYQRPLVMTCDRWSKVEWNLYAIGKDIEAQRARERWGCTNYEQAFRGYLAIPEKCGGLSWWETLKIDPAADRDAIETAFKKLALKLHPDKGGNPEDWNKLQEARDQALARFTS